MTLDLHTLQMHGFFRAPVGDLTAVPALCAALRSRLPDGIAIVSPDAGRVPMATEYADCLGAPLIVLHKRRESRRETAVAHVAGDVRDRACLVIDDMIATGGTIAESMRTLREAGARPEIWVAATHGLFIEHVLDRPARAGVKIVFTTDTISQTGSNRLQMEVVSIAPLLATALQRFMADGSIGDLYE